MLLRLTPQDGLTVFPRILDEVTSPKQTQLLNKMAMDDVLANPADISRALDDYLTKIRRRQPKAQRQRIIEQLRTVGDGTAEQQRLIQEYDRLRKEQPISSS
jgi:hypothetical protein